MQIKGEREIDLEPKVYTLSDYEEDGQYTDMRFGYNSIFILVFVTPACCQRDIVGTLVCLGDLPSRFLTLFDDFGVC